MKKFVLAVAVSTVAFAGAAFANAGAGLVGNTVTLTGPDGAVTKIYYPDASSIVVKGADGSEAQGTWRVDGDKICTTVADAAENCTAPVEEAPTVGSSGTIEGEQGAVQWAVTEGKGF
ncbi:hypothetical protein [Parvibaculum sp.]|jgi:hypothetical protein|uniref:hypothetical protein n=1 Tax=Parvibaculum sp. TaxID=2024848 RepID=UPI000C4ABDDD|nr:hypothetical protein [Parvibaculum sp.]HAC58181.1 hypothetical protein [Rhodobiaceae bacterium]MAU61924.1 hypothetical protein [Parvibaculum sp.]MBO6666816.1 hypothetical protein [Parvibaculum sp.]MBO6691666.1 hypothetical protein [Parvibaculum sp.]MBO6713437.1 hypothetical protein [Parvibaculum sp.]|tara:strand:+ start:1862 stop:2215 length:354 start_codon:yes stop_codon:yes gene_type:complete